LSVSSFARAVSNAGRFGSLPPLVEKNNVSPLATGIPIEPLEPTGIHHLDSPVSSAYESMRVEPSVTICAGAFAVARNTIGVAQLSGAPGRSFRHRTLPV